MAGLDWLLLPDSVAPVDVDSLACRPGWANSRGVWRPGTAELAVLCFWPFQKRIEEQISLLAVTATGQLNLVDHRSVPYSGSPGIGSYRLTWNAAGTELSWHIGGSLHTWHPRGAAAPADATNPFATTIATVTTDDDENGVTTSPDGHWRAEVVDDQVVITSMDDAAIRWETVLTGCSNLEWQPDR